LGLINEIGCNPQIVETAIGKKILKQTYIDNYGHLLLFLKNLPNICTKVWCETNIIATRSMNVMINDTVRRYNNNPEGSMHSPYMISLTDLAFTLPKVY
jgi:hypothetical protein